LIQVERPTLIKLNPKPIKKKKKKGMLYLLREKIMIASRITIALVKIQYCSAQNIGVAGIQRKPMQS